MTKFRRTLAAVVVGAAATVAVSSMQVGANAVAQPSGGVVSVSNEGGVVHVGSGVPGQPLLGASVDTNTGRACVGFSYQVPQCASVGLGTQR